MITQYTAGLIPAANLFQPVQIVIYTLGEGGEPPPPPPPPPPPGGEEDTYLMRGVVYGHRHNVRGIMNP